MRAPFYFTSLPSAFALFTLSPVANISLRRGDAIVVNLASRQHCARSERKPVIRAKLCLSHCQLARPPPPVETGHSPDLPRMYLNLTKPFIFQIRQLSGERNIKLIWWYIAAINEDEPIKKDCLGKEKFQVVLVGYEDALQKLTYQLDREILQKAINVVEATYG